VQKITSYPQKQPQMVTFLSAPRKSTFEEDLLSLELGHSAL